MYDDGGWAPYVSVAERRRNAERLVAKLRKGGQKLAPVTLTGTKIATSFWGRAWCDNLESYRDYDYRLDRGRSYVRHGCVIDLKIAAGQISAMVNGSELYRIAITIKPPPAARWRSICAECAGEIDSLMELLQGRFSKHVMARLCRQENGLFPSPSDIRFTCSCPDHASLCKHVAAVLYGVGARLDEQPALLFRLRSVDESELIAGIDEALPLAAQGDGTRVLETDDISALFGLDMAAPAPAAEPAAAKPTSPVKRARATVKTQIAAAAVATSRQVPAKKGAEPSMRMSADTAARRVTAPSRTGAAAKPIRTASASKATIKAHASGKAETSDARRAGREEKPRPVKWWLKSAPNGSKRSK